MYQALLTRRYLTSKVMPLLASAAVMLCSAMVLITWSVMGGFLDKLLAAGRNAIGDVAVVWPNTGFGHYEELIKIIESDPDIEAAAPMIQSYSLISLPDGRTEPCVVRGIDPPRMDRVTGYYSSLHWRPLDVPLPKDTQRRDIRLEAGMRPLFDRMLADGRTLMASPDPPAGRDWPRPRPGAVLGIEVSKFNFREVGGWYEPGVPVARTTDGQRRTLRDQYLLPHRGEIVVQMFPLDRKSGKLLGPAEISTFRAPVVNEFRSGVYEVDEKTVFLPLDEMQRRLKMNHATRIERKDASAAGSGFKVVIDPNTNQETIQMVEGTVVEDPARVTHVLVRAKGDALTPDEVAIRVLRAYERFEAKFRGQVPIPPMVKQVNGADKVAPVEGSIQIVTWEDQNRTLIEQVRKETSVVLFVFCFVSLTAVFLVLAIFWSMVSEKTKDIGILRAVGAGRSGVALVWLAYGLTIGLVGSSLGLLVGHLIVTNINPIHEWLGANLGLAIWDPKVYYFSDIPSRVRPMHAAIVFAGGVVSCVVGALIPSIRAAWMHPVKALRFE